MNTHLHNLDKRLDAILFDDDPNHPIRHGAELAGAAGAGVAGTLGIQALRRSGGVGAVQAGFNSVGSNSATPMLPGMKLGAGYEAGQAAGNITKNISEASGKALGTVKNAGKSLVDWIKTLGKGGAAITHASSKLDRLVHLSAQIDADLSDDSAAEKKKPEFPEALKDPHLFIGEDNILNNPKKLAQWLSIKKIGKLGLPGGKEMADRSETVSLEDSDKPRPYPQPGDLTEEDWNNAYKHPELLKRVKELKKEGSLKGKSMDEPEIDAMAQLYATRHHKAMRDYSKKMEGKNLSAWLDKLLEFNADCYPNAQMVKMGTNPKPIHIKAKNKGKFDALKKRTGESTEELEHSKNPLTRRRAVFAENASHWQH